MYDTYSWYNHNLKRHTLIKSLLDIYEILAIFLVLIYSNTNTIVPWCWVLWRWFGYPWRIPSTKIIYVSILMVWWIFIYQERCETQPPISGTILILVWYNPLPVGFCWNHLQTGFHLLRVFINWLGYYLLF